MDSDPHFAAEGEKVERVDVGFVETSAAPPTFGGRVDCPEERERPSQVVTIYTCTCITCTHSKSHFSIYATLKKKSKIIVYMYMYTL